MGKKVEHEAKDIDSKDAFAWPCLSIQARLIRRSLNGNATDICCRYHHEYSQSD